MNEIPHADGTSRWEAIAADPRSSPAELREALRHESSLMALVATNPSVDEPLRAWLWRRGGRSVRQAMLRAAGTAARLPPERAESDSTPAATDLPVNRVQEASEETVLIRRSLPEEQLDETATVLLPGRGGRPLGILETDTGTRVALLSEEILVGRRPVGADRPHAQLVALDDPSCTASRTHLLLTTSRPRGVWTVTDLGSSNGTQLDTGQALQWVHPHQPTPVRGALLLGRIRFRILDPGEQFAPSGEVTFSGEDAREMPPILGDDR